jgi:hypothetical protein
MAEGVRPALYHLAVDQQLADFYREAQTLAGSPPGFEVELDGHVDVVMDLDADEVMMKLRAIECHPSQLEDWRIALRDHPHLMQRGYGHEPYITVSSRATGLTEKGLLGEFA